MARACPKSSRGITPRGDRPAPLLAGLPEPDLIIRTSGELRLSGFLLVAKRL